MAQTELRKATQLAWRRLLISEYGIEGLLVLRENIPSVTGQGDAHKIAFDAGVAEGYRRAIEALHTMIAVEKVKNEDFDNK